MLSNILPDEYHWIIKREILGHSTFSQMSPWYLINEKDLFNFNSKDNGVKLIAFARRQDCDDFACFKIEENILKVVLIQGWTSEGYDEIEYYSDIWEWLKSVIDDVKQTYLEIKENS
jgi:hypothetical protein